MNKSGQSGDSSREVWRRTVIKEYGSLEAWMRHQLEKGAPQERVYQRASNYGFPNEAIDGAFISITRGEMGELRVPAATPLKRADRGLAECRALTLSLVLQEHGSILDWVYYMRRRDMKDSEIIAFATQRGFFDEEIEGALIELRREPLLFAHAWCQRKEEEARAGRGVTLLVRLRHLKEIGLSRAHAAAKTLAEGYGWNAIEDCLDQLKKSENDS